MSTIINFGKTYDNKSYTLNDILNMINDKKFAIPNLQREYKWKEKDVLTLADSLFKMFNIGQFLVMPYSSNFELGLKSLHGFGDINGKMDSSHKYVFDGQQRITSIAKIFLQPTARDNYNFDLLAILNSEYDLGLDIEKNYIVKKDNNHADWRYLNCKMIMKEVDNQKARVNVLEERIKKFLESSYVQQIEENKLKKIEMCGAENIEKHLDNMLTTTYNFSVLSNNVDYNFLEENFHRFNNSGLKLTAFELINSRSLVRYDDNGNKVNGSESLADVLNRDLIAQLKVMPQLKQFYELFLSYKENGTKKNKFEKLDNLLKIIHLIESYSNKEELGNGLLSERNDILKYKADFWFNAWDKHKENLFKCFNWFVESKLTVVCPAIIYLFFTFFIIHCSSLYSNSFKGKLVIESGNPRFLEWLKDTMVHVSLDGVSLGRKMIADLTSIHTAMKKYIKNQQDNTIEAALSFEKMSFRDLFTVEEILKSKKGSLIGKYFSYCLQTNRIDVNVDLSGVQFKNGIDFDFHHLIPKSTKKNEAKWKREEYDSIANQRLLNSTFNQQIIGNKKFHTYMSELEANIGEAKFKEITTKNLIPLDWKNMEDYEILKEMAVLLTEALNKTL